MLEARRHQDVVLSTTRRRLTRFPGTLGEVDKPE